MQTRSQRKQPQCSVCFERITLRGKLDHCNHYFCALCISRWAQTENTCPLCKRRFRSISRIPTRPLYSDHAKRLVGTEIVEERNQDKNTFVQLYMNSLQNSQYYNSDEDVHFLTFLLALDEQLDEL